MSGGRGKPPVEHRFRKGQSGNPKGRPRKERVEVRSAFDIVIDRRLTVVQGGRERELTIDEALQQQAYQQAIAGNRSSRREVLKMIARREKALADKIPVQRKAAEWKMERADPDNADDALLILGIARLDAKWSDDDPHRRLLLETWATQAALSRRRGHELSQSDVDNIRRSTFEPDQLRGLEVTKV